MEDPRSYFPPDRPYAPRIRNLDELRGARKIVRERVKQGEEQLKARVQELPGQLIYSGFKYVIPSMLSGKITNTVLEAGKSVVDLFFVKKGMEGTGRKSALAQNLKKAGVLTAVKWGFRLLARAI